MGSVGTVGMPSTMWPLLHGETTESPYTSSANTWLSYMPSAIAGGASAIGTLMMLLIIIVYRKWVNQSQVPGHIDHSEQ
jgi:hypothetical protein